MFLERMFTEAWSFSSSQIKLHQVPTQDQTLDPSTLHLPLEMNAQIEWVRKSSDSLLVTAESNIDLGAKGENVINETMK